MIRCDSTKVFLKIIEKIFRLFPYFQSVGVVSILLILWEHISNVNCVDDQHNHENQIKKIQENNRLVELQKVASV